MRRAPWVSPRQRQAPSALVSGGHYGCRSWNRNSGHTQHLSRGFSSLKPHNRLPPGFLSSLHVLDPGFVNLQVGDQFVARKVDIRYFDTEKEEYDRRIPKSKARGEGTIDEAEIEVSCGGKLRYTVLVGRDHSGGGGSSMAPGWGGHD
jgi:hypothetical protein